MQFEFATANRIVFGAGAATKVPGIAEQFGRRAFVVVGSSEERARPLLQQLREKGLEVVTFSVGGEPTTDIALEGAMLARDSQSDVVIGIGGGSVVDAGKVIAALLTNSGDLLDYLEVVGEGKPITQRPAPYVAVPTTAGTGAEVTRNAVLLSPEHKVKVSMRHQWLLPDVAVVDPELTYSMPRAVAASTGLDALTQLIEAFVSNKANPLTDGVCREGLVRAARSLRIAYESAEGDMTPGGVSAREDMAVASLFGGLALANAKLGAVHGFAGPMGGMFPVPHGIVCARLLPHVMDANVRALQQRMPGSSELKRFEELARILTGDPAADIAAGIDWLNELCAALEVAPLREFGLKEADFDDIVAKAQKASSMKGNPIALTDDELAGILAKAL